MSRELEPGQKESMKQLLYIYDAFLHGLERAFSSEGFTSEQATVLYKKTRPLMEMLIGQVELQGGLLAPMAHTFMDIINKLVRYDPQGTLLLAAGVVRASRSAGYHIDSIAVRDVNTFVEAILTDFRGDIQEPAQMAALLDILDVFGEAGWPEVQRLVWRLEEIFR